MRIKGFRNEHHKRRVIVKAIELQVASSLSLRDISRRLNVSETQVIEWVQEYHKGSKTSGNITLPSSLNSNKKALI